MIYIDLFLDAEAGSLSILRKMFKCLFIAQMNHKCIKKSVGVIVK